MFETIRVQGDQDTARCLDATGNNSIVRPRQILLGHGVRAEAGTAQQGCALRGQVLVDFEVQVIRSSGSAAVPSRANSAA